MIIGHGDIASALKELPRKTSKKNWIFFASGVSKSQEKRESEYQREKDLLLKQNKRKHLVYFGSLSIFHSMTKYSNKLYLKHKKEMERLVKQNFPNYTIVRLGNITWGKNPHTLINTLRARIKRGEKFKIPNTYRYLVDKDEFLHWINMIPSWNCEINITGQRFKLTKIIEEFVK